MVVRSTKKVVQESAQVSVVSSSQRLTRDNTDVQIGKDVDSTLKQEQVRTIPIHEVTPQAEEDASTTSITEDKAKHENTPNDQVQYQTEGKKKDTATGAQTGEGNDGKEKSNGEGYQRYVYRVLKHVHPEMGISSQAMTILNNLINDMLERLADEAAEDIHRTHDTVVKGDPRSSEAGFAWRPWEACHC